jgi:hypothetical protein
MAIARSLAVVPRRPCEAGAPLGQVSVKSRLAAVLRRFLSGLEALADHVETVDDLPPEFFRFPPF